MIATYQFFNLKSKKLDKPTVFYLFCFVFIHYLIYEIAARMAIFSLFAVEAGMIFIWFLLQKKNYLQGILLLSILVVSFIIGILFVPNANKRIVQRTKIEGRSFIWQTSIEQFGKSPIIGYGAGDLEDIMINGYKKIGYITGIERRQNCHNQYLESALATGIIGLIVILGWLFLAFLQGWKSQDYVICIFIAIIALNFLTESMLERQQGTYFVAFFGSLAFHNSSKL